MATSASNKSACSDIYANLLQMMHRYDQVLMHHIMPTDSHFINRGFQYSPLTVLNLDGSLAVYPMNIGDNDNHI